jgi:anaerobic selenocysteine-containing dehydrogenase
VENLNRRQFLKNAGLGAAAVAVAPLVVEAVKAAPAVAVEPAGITSGYALRCLEERERLKGAKWRQVYCDENVTAFTYETQLQQLKVIVDKNCPVNTMYALNSEDWD